MKTDETESGHLNDRNESDTTVGQILFYRLCTNSSKCIYLSLRHIHIALTELNWTELQWLQWQSVYYRYCCFPLNPKNENGIYEHPFSSFRRKYTKTKNYRQNCRLESDCIHYATSNYWHRHKTQIQKMLKYQIMTSIKGDWTSVHFSLNPAIKIVPFGGCVFVSTHTTCDKYWNQCSFYSLAEI